MIIFIPRFLKLVLLLGQKLGTLHVMIRGFHLLDRKARLLPQRCLVYRILLEVSLPRRSNWWLGTIRFRNRSLVSFLKILGSNAQVKLSMRGTPGPSSGQLVGADGSLRPPSPNFVHYLWLTLQERELLFSRFFRFVPVLVNAAQGDLSRLTILQFNILGTHLMLLDIHIQILAWIFLQIGMRTSIPIHWVKVMHF